MPKIIQRALQSLARAAAFNRAAITNAKNEAYRQSAEGKVTKCPGCRRPTFALGHPGVVSTLGRCTLCGHEGAIHHTA